jgi:paraquat-inducible protein B
MSERPEEPPERDELPEVSVAPRRGISMVWLIPLVAGLIAVWLGYTTIMEKGPTITITFKTAAGLVAGKTKVKYRDVEVGLVEDVAIAEGGAHIVATASLDKRAKPHLTEGTRFWVVRPRLGVGGVSGLGTLVSGAYIEVEPGTGAPTLAFTGLEVPPVVLAYEAGRKFLLQADSLGSLSPGSPIYYRGLEVGEVLGYELVGEGRGVEIHIFVKEPHYPLIRENTRFWNASGIDISLGADGFTVSTASVQSILSGGIAFDTPASATSVETAAEGTSFKLFKDLAGVSEASYTEKTPYVAYFDGSVRGLQVGAPVEFRGIRVGSVTDVALEINRRTTTIRIPVTFQIEPQRVNVLDVSGGGTMAKRDPYEDMARLVKRGLRAQLQSGSLLTGQLVVALDFHPDSPAAELRTKGKYPEIPTIPSELEEITQSVEQVLAKIGALPLEELVKDLRKTIQDANQLIASPEILQSIVSLNQTLSELQTLVRTVDSKVGPLLASMEGTSEAAQAALSQAKTTLIAADGFVGERSEVRYDLSLLMKELTEAARSIRVLTDYLEQHPEALLRGKGRSED